jgi:hypothetical protein
MSLPNRDKEYPLSSIHPRKKFYLYEFFLVLRIDPLSARVWEGFLLVDKKEWNPFDVIILDYKMPIKDGLEVARVFFSETKAKDPIFDSSNPQKDFG